MTVASLTNTATYVGNNSTATYSYPFKVFSKADLYVTTKAVDGTKAVLVVDVDFTVTGVKAAAGGTIVLSAGNLATGVTLTIKRQPAILQTRDFQNQGKYYASDAEDAWDYVTMVAQALTEQIGRAYKVDDFTTPPAVVNGAVDLVTVAAETAARIAADAAEAAARAAADALLAKMSWGGMIADPQVKTYVIEQYAPCAGTITALKAQLGSGTCTAAVKIDGTPVTSISAAACDNTAKTFTATAANTFTAGQKITLVITAIAAPVDLGLSILWTKATS